LLCRCLPIGKISLLASAGSTSAQIAVQLAEIFIEKERKSRVRIFEQT